MALKDEIAQRLDEFYKFRDMDSSCDSIYKTSNEYATKYGITRRRIEAPVFYGKRNNDAEHHWSLYPNKVLDYNRPIVFCLGGNGSTDFQSANGFCKRAEKSLELVLDKQDIENKVDIVGCSYRVAQTMYMPTQNLKDMVNEGYSDLAKYIYDVPNSVQGKDKKGKFTSSDAVKFVETYLLPRCKDENQNFDLTQCCKNMSQVTFLTYCYGAEALNMIMQKLNESLKQNGFSDEDIRTINSSMGHISFARRAYTRDIPTINFFSPEDSDAGSTPRLAQAMKKRGDTIILKHTRSGELTYGQSDPTAKERLRTTDSMQEALEVVYAGLKPGVPLEGESQHRDHNIANFDRNDDWSIKSRDIKFKELDCMSQMMAWSLSKMVDNSLSNSKSDTYVPKPPLKELQKELDKIKESFQAGEFSM